MNLAEIIEPMGLKARQASRALARLSPLQINAGLEAMAQSLEAQRDFIQQENAKDVAQAESQGLSAALVDRLRLKEKNFNQMVEGLRQVIALPNPVGEVIRDWNRPNGLHITKIRVPIGVIGIIYESRPNVTVDASVLCLKTKNAVILRGGSEAFYSNTALTAALQAGARQAGLPEAAVQLVPTTDREAIKVLCAQDRYIDLMIPRGGHGLIETVAQHARMPVIKHYHGVCHVYVQADADLALAEKIILNGKVQRPGVCNAVETVLIDETIAEKFVPQLVRALEKNKVEIRGDALTRRYGGAGVKNATEEDWTTEYLDLILSVRVVRDLPEAMDHLDRYGSHHSDAIITANEAVARQFLAEVDSATVYWNASTRFTDGYEFGFGAEIGISTDKIHARGPMALEELTSYKYQIVGHGQIRA
jgi:glutamate-5-semialdehyde dehydrogenase